MSELLGEKCGVFGIFGKDMDVSRLTYYGLFALQHRGQESSGIATSNGWRINVFKNKGLVTHAYSEENIQALKGHIAIGHNRYSTSEGTGLLHAQPVLSRSGDLALAHNGNLPSVVKLQKFLQSKKIVIENLTDSELMTDAIGYYLEQGETLPAAVKKSFPLFTGAFSVVAMTRDTLVAFRDHCGIRPLAVGKLNGGTVFASETCAFSTIGAEFVREIKPGEMVVVTEGETKSVQLAPGDQKFDIFEFVYFARPDSVLLGQSVYEVRRRCGEILAKENPLKIDIVVPVPETAIPVAVGYAEASGVPFEMAIVKNRYVHRTFIEPDQHSRDLGVKLKLVPLPGILKGKKVGLIDDSIVRGTTSRQLTKAIFDAGAKEVHFMVSSPPVKFPDFYGIDTPRQDKLIAAIQTEKQIQKFLGATSLHYLSLAGLVKATSISRSKLSLSCFTGEYPVDIFEREKEIKRL